MTQYAIYRQEGEQWKFVGYVYAANLRAAETQAKSRFNGRIQVKVY